MYLNEQQQENLDNSNEKMSKTNLFKCPTCKGTQTKRYCGKCDNFYYFGSHKISLITQTVIGDK